MLFAILTPLRRLELVPSAAQLISGKPLCDANVPSAALPLVGRKIARIPFLYCAVTGATCDSTVRSLVTYI